MYLGKILWHKRTHPHKIYSFCLVWKESEKKMGKKIKFKHNAPTFSSHFPRTFISFLFLPFSQEQIPSFGRKKKSFKHNALTFSSHFPRTFISFIFLPFSQVFLFFLDQSFTSWPVYLRVWSPWPMALTRGESTQSRAVPCGARLAIEVRPFHF